MTKTTKVPNEQISLPAYMQSEQIIVVLDPLRESRTNFGDPLNNESMFKNCMNRNIPNKSLYFGITIAPEQ